MTDPATALQGLGLSKYEAEVFVALRQIASGTASDVATLADVPRSQVYGAAEDLEERGLVDVQHASPKRYRAVSLEEAGDRLRRDFEREHERAFDALSDLDATLPDGEERQEDIWTVTGRETIDARIEAFLREAESSVRFGAEQALYDESIAATLVEVADSATVTVVCTAGSTVEDFADTPVETIRLPETYDRDELPTSRFLVVDERTLLLSVLGPDGEESAFWSSDTDFARLLVRLLDGHFGQFVEF